MLVDVAALVLAITLVVYVLTGGADYGGGVWVLLASGSRARQQRALIEKVLAPIWEANHVWLIVVVVVLFACFPPAFAAVTTALHIPLTLFLVGVVLRGSAFVFRHYGMEGAAGRRRWSRVFAGASVVTPVMLGVCAGALSTGMIRVQDGLVTSGFFAGWTGPFAGVVGLLTLALCAQLAAVYLVVEAEASGLPALRDDFAVRGILATAVTGGLALVAAVLSRGGAPGLWEELTGSFGAVIGLPAGAVAAVATVLALHRRDVHRARLAVGAQTVLLLGGWAAALHPHALRPDLTLAEAAAPTEVLAVTLGILGLGAVFLLPALAWLFRVFEGAAGER